MVLTPQQQHRCPSAREPGHHGPASVSAVVFSMGQLRCTTDPNAHVVRLNMGSWDAMATCCGCRRFRSGFLFAKHARTHVDPAPHESVMAPEGDIRAYMTCIIFCECMMALECLRCCL